ncbi:hypothetical protein B0H14DRAFT_2567650 [Mycena olivaceomarginata]|nr:hypothetical protein B0H14DRAFT_2567650 [Mycena olivaceomarginata]
MPVQYTGLHFEEHDLDLNSTIHRTAFGKSMTLKETVWPVPQSEGLCSSRGVLDSIRACLGLVRATSLQRGQHEDFELADTKTLAPAHLKSKKGQDVFAPEASVVEYNHRTVRFIKLRGERIHYSPDGSKPDITFYVHHLVQDNGSLIGAMSAYLLRVAEWYYGDALSMRGFPPEVVQRYTNTQAATLVPNVFETAFTHFTGGIVSLAEQDLVHRDLSIGNVLLSQDALCPSAFLSDAAASAGALLRVPVSFTQRPLEQRMGGLIHDMDMAGRLHRLPEQSPADSTSTADLLAMLLDTPGPPARAEQLVGHQKGFRTGTPPFMAIGLLVDGGPHLVAYDLTSPPATQPIICYGVIFLEPPHVLFRHSLPSVGAREEQDMVPGCVAMGEPPGRVPPRRAGIRKEWLFSKPQILRDVLQDTLGEEALWTADPKYLRLFWALYGALWMAVPEKLEWIDRSNVTAADVEQALANHRQVRARIN